MLPIREEIPLCFKILTSNLVDMVKTSEYTTEAKVMVPPLNFAMVAPGVYRSGHPNRQNFPFLIKLGLKSIM